MTKKRQKHVLRLAMNGDYQEFYTSIKKAIQAAQIRTSFAVNTELLRLYWNIGKTILERQKEKGWGDAVVVLLAEDLRRDFPGMRGFSRANVFTIRQWYLFYREAGTKVQQLVGLLPWGHNMLILNKVKDISEAIFYASCAYKNGWSRNVLAHQIENGFYYRKGKAVTNFSKTLPAPQSDMAVEALKDPYHFDFLTIGEKVQEVELENSLLKHLHDFLLELGVGFAFVGRQKHLEISGKDFYIDLLFYHIHLHAYVVIELKMDEFKPEYAGKMNFYLNAIDGSLRRPGDNPSIGLILCKSKNQVIVEYALKNTSKPIGVSEYTLTKNLPKNLKGKLPTIREIKRKVGA